MIINIFYLILPMVKIIPHISRYKNRKAKNLLTYLSLDPDRYNRRSDICCFSIAFTIPEDDVHFLRL